MNGNSPEYYEAYRLAERRVKAKVGFYWHLASYLTVNGMLIVIYLLTSLPVGELYYPWFIWPLAMWGVGLLFNFLGVFVFPDSTNPNPKMISDELHRMGYNPTTTQYPPTQPPVDSLAGKPDRP